MSIWTNYFLYCISIAFIKIKRSDQKNLREERIYLTYTFRSHSITEGRQGKLPSRHQIHKSQRNSACCHTCQIVVSWLSYTAQGHLHLGLCQPRWSRSFYTKSTHDSSSTDMTPDQSDMSKPAIQTPFSDGSRLCKVNNYR